jgi:DNA-nicking Smr family endonuclease
MDEFSDFKAAMSGVKPLKVNKKVDLIKNKQSRAAIEQRRLDATLLTESITNHLSDDYVHMVQPYDVLSYRRNGLQDGVFRKFRLGKYAIDARLDLHKKTVNQARADVYEFIEDAIKYDLRNLMILHGKGEKESTPALLKSWVNKWLPQLEDVLAYHSCQQKHGGTGAVYVMLRKSEKKKQQTRDQLGIK